MTTNTAISSRKNRAATGYWPQATGCLNVVKFVNLAPYFKTKHLQLVPCRNTINPREMEAKGLGNHPVREAPAPEKRAGRTPAWAPG